MNAPQERLLFRVKRAGIDKLTTTRYIPVPICATPSALWESLMQETDNWEHLYSNRMIVYSNK